MSFRLATRGSRLAWAQSGMVADLLRARGHAVELVRITTHGDVSTAPLASLGGAGVFVGAVRSAVLAGEADFAVHSFKDLPTAEQPGLLLAAVPQREDPADALCARDGMTLAELPAGSRVGTGSPRRAAQLLARRPDLETVAIRGNVETRLGRVGDDLDAVLLAAAGLRRLGLAQAITELLDPDDFLPAPAQGALALECRIDAAEGLLAALAELDDPSSRQTALAERAVLSRLEAGCAAPVAARAVVTSDRLELLASVTAVDGSARLIERVTGSPADAELLGGEVAELLLASGAAELVDLAAERAKPLAGRTILVPHRAPSGTAAALTAAGAQVILASFTEQRPLELDELVAALAEPWDWLVVTSVQTVTALREAGLTSAARLSGTRVAAVGPATAAALGELGLVPDLVPRPAGGTALAEAFPSGPGRVLFPGADERSAQPAAGLTAKGWDVRSVAVYQTVLRSLPQDVVSGWRAGAIDGLVVTAGSVARAAVAAAGVPGPAAIAIGDAAAAVARSLGLTVAAVADRPTATALTDAAIAGLAARQSEQEASR